jgi:hypothetical protein
MDVKIKIYIECWITETRNFHIIQHESVSILKEKENCTTLGKDSMIKASLEKMKFFYFSDVTGSVTFFDVTFNPSPSSSTKLFAQFWIS